MRENAPDGQAKNKISATITENTVAIAHYLETNEDSDSDGVPDWFEIRMFATLDHNESYDGDGDGVTLAEERQFGLAATIADDFLEGGASIRRSAWCLPILEVQKNSRYRVIPPGCLQPQKLSRRLIPVTPVPI